MVPNSSFTESGEAAKGQAGNNHTTLDHATMVPNYPRDAGVLPTSSSSESRPGNTTNSSGRLHNETGSTRVGCMAHLRESFRSRGISAEASDLLL